jgi:predicted flap endonuclease-1-like 5' DNA nuclease
VGASNKDTNKHADAGVVYVYEWVDGRYKEITQLITIDASINGWYGISVSLSGNRLAVGAYGDDESARKIYVYEWVGTEYIEVARLTNPNYTYGISVSLSGNRLVVGGTAKTNAANIIYTYNWDGERYVELTQLTTSDVCASEHWGSSVSLSGNRLVVGDSGAATDKCISGAGKVYVYELQDNGYVEVAQLTANDAESYDGYGDAVHIKDNMLMVGAAHKDVSGISGAGKVYVYELQDNTYVEVAQLTANDASPGDNYGGAITSTDERIVVGAYGKDTDVQVEAGGIYTYILK